MLGRLGKEHRATALLIKLASAVRTPAHTPRHHRSSSSTASIPEPETENATKPLRFEFLEEPLGLPWSQGYGFYQGKPGNIVGPDRRFKLENKLGFGMTSNVWLAKDLQQNGYVAVKVLCGTTSHWNRENKLRELETLQRLASPVYGESSKRCIRLIDHFTQPGVEPEDGEHLCLVTEVTGPDIGLLQEAIGAGWFSLPAVKRMLRCTITALAELHARGVAHTDLKPDNILIDLSDVDITPTVDQWVIDNPPETHPPEQSWKKMVTPYVSKYLPAPPFDELHDYDVKLADFGSAQIVSDQTTDDITPLGLRPPEIILGAEWNEAVDIWTYGCMVFTILTGKPLFLPLQISGQSEEDTILYQMACFCDDVFKAEFLARCSRGEQYFDRDCSLKVPTNKRIVRKTFQECVRAGRPMLGQQDVDGAVALMAKALRLDPKNRATAKELMADPWLSS